MAYDDVITDGVNEYILSHIWAKCQYLSGIFDRGGEEDKSILFVNKFWEIEEDLLWKSIYWSPCNILDGVSICIAITMAKCWCFI